MNTFCSRILSRAAVVVALALCANLAAGQIVISINDVPNGAPVIQVKGAPNGFDVYTGEGVADPAVEDGALITLFGVNQCPDPESPPEGTLPDWGGRFMDPRPWETLPPWYPLPDGENYRYLRTAVDIIWVQHDVELFGNGDLQVGFNSSFPGTWYYIPELWFIDEVNLGPVTNNWVTVYANDLLVIRYKPHTYILKK